MYATKEDLLEVARSLSTQATLLREQSSLIDRSKMSYLNASITTC